MSTSGVPNFNYLRFQISLKFQISNFKFPPSLLFAAILPFLLLSGCSKPQQIGPSYTLLKSRDSFNNHALSCLRFRGSNVWPAVLVGSEQSFHDGAFVFLSPVPGPAGDFDMAVSPQLFAIRESGPAVLISERLFGKPLEHDLPWRVEGFVPRPGGLSVDFSSAQPGGSNTHLNRLVTWSEIDRLLLEADSASVKELTPLAPYRLLLFKASDTPSSATNSLPFKSLDGMNR
jgi:hypothetical protein